jgi:hypothetical protein
MKTPTEPIFFNQIPAEFLVRVSHFWSLFCTPTPTGGAAKNTGFPVVDTENIINFPSSSVQGGAT